MSALRTDWGYTAVGATSPRPARVLAAVVLLGMAALPALLLLPASTTEPSVTPELGIGGGPRAEPGDESAGAICQTDDGAPYEAGRCSSE